MRMQFSPFARLLLSAICVVALNACAHTKIKRWSGDYMAGESRLQLQPTGEFSYDGGYCFVADSDSDVGFTDQARGRFHLEGGWLVLQPDSSLITAPCSSMASKLYAIRAEGHRYLIDERYLRDIAHDLRRGAAVDRVFPWHIAGSPVELTTPAREWLPASIARWVDVPPPSGQVTAIGPVQRRTRYGTAGRVDGEELFAELTVGFGHQQGAFEGMSVCLPGRPYRYRLASVSGDSATLRWTWSVSGEGAPELGMTLDSACR